MSRQTPVEFVDRSQSKWSDEMRAFRNRPLTAGFIHEFSVVKILIPRFAHIIGKAFSAVNYFRNIIRTLVKTTPLVISVISPQRAQGELNGT